MSNNIKDYRDKELKMYDLANIFVLLYLEKIITIEGLIGSTGYVTLIINILNSALFSAILYIFVLLSDFLISTNLKYRIVYLWNKLPGQTIFSRMKKNVKDERFTQKQILEQYKDIYEELPNNKKDKCKFENSKWYTIYDKYRDVTMIYVSNRDYLICRDMTNSTVIILILYTIFSLLLDLIPYKMESMIYLIIMYIVTNIATRMKGKRFVNNVIACDLQKKKISE